MQMKSMRGETLDWSNGIGQTLNRWLEEVRGKVQLGPNALVAVLSAILAVPIAIRVYGGTLVRWTGDDWCWPTNLTSRAVEQPQQSFWSMQVFAYDHYFGRWASTFLLTVAGQLGQMTAPVLASGIIVLWLASMAWCVYELTHRPALSLLFAEAIVVATFLAAPGLGIEATYWQAGLLTYMPPIVLAGIGIASAVRFKSVPLAMGIAFVAAGFNEPFTCFECAALALLLVVCPRQYRLLVACAMLAAVFSGAIMVLAPGNSIRAGNSDTTSFASLPGLTLSATYHLMLSVLKSPAGLAPLLMGIVFAGQVRAPGWASPLAIVVVSFGLAAAALLPQEFGTRYIIFRAAFLPAFIFVLGFFGLGLHLGASLTAMPRSTALAGVFGIVAVLGASQAYGLIGPLNSYRSAVAFDDQTLRTAAITQPHQTWTLPKVYSPFSQVWSLKADPTWKINQCIAAYYGVDGVKTGGAPLSPLRN